MESGDFGTCVSTDPRSATTGSRPLRSFPSSMCASQWWWTSRASRTGRSPAGTVATSATPFSSVRVSRKSPASKPSTTGGASMRQVQCWKLQAWLLVMPMLLILLLAGSQAQGQPAAGKAKVDRLVLGLIEKYRDYWRPWINGTPDHMIQHDPVFEWLVEVAPDGTYKPWLADSWDLAPDGRSWRVKLHKGVQFHHGYGEFTAKDVVHSHALWCDDNYPGRKDPTTVGYKNGICQVDRVEVVNDYEVVMHCKVVCLEWPFYYSSASTVVIFSKAQWEKEGEMALEARPAGTGPYIFKERAPDRYVLFERAPTPHWKWGTVDWKEL